MTVEVTVFFGLSLPLLLCRPGTGRLAAAGLCDVEVEWRAFELHPEIPPEGMRLPAHMRARLAPLSDRVVQMAREVGMEMVIFPEAAES